MIIIFFTFDLIAAVLFHHLGFVWVKASTESFLTSSFGSFHPDFLKMLVWDKWLLLVDETMESLLPSAS